MDSIRLNTLFCVALLTLARGQNEPRTTTCLPSLATDPVRFNVCLTKECFIFIDEPPFVFVPDTFANGVGDKPFRCVEHLKYSKELHGAWFDIMKDMPELLDAYCVFGGGGCTFKSMVKFVNSSTPEAKYRWIAGGLLFVIPQRIQRNVIPSAALLSDRLLVIGPPQNGIGLGEAWKTISKPFTPFAWLAIVGCILILFVIRSFIVCLYPGNAEGRDDRSCARFWRRFSQVNINTRENQRNNDENEWDCLNETWFSNAKLFIGITVILYEVVIAVKVLEASTSGPTPYSDATKFAMFKDTTQEFFFMKMQGTDTLTNHKWSRFKTQREVYSAMKNPKSEAKLTLMWSILNRYEMTERPELCTKLRAYDHVSPRLAIGRQPPTLTGHWLYSTNVPIDRRIAIDREIVERKVGRLRRIVERIAGDELPEGCQSKVRRIDFLLIFLFFLLLSGPPFGALILALFLLWTRRRRRSMRADSERKVAEELVSHCKRGVRGSGRYDDSSSDSSTSWSLRRGDAV